MTDEAITVQQGRLIKVLTLYTIFFLPFTFITILTTRTIKLDPTEGFRHFGFITVAICVLTYSVFFIAVLNIESSLRLWSRGTHLLRYHALYTMARILQTFGLKPGWTFDYLEGPDDPHSAGPLKQAVAQDHPLASERSREVQVYRRPIIKNPKIRDGPWD